jgi:hypothetical protein
VPVPGEAGIGKTALLLAADDPGRQFRSTAASRNAMPTSGRVQAGNVLNSAMTALAAALIIQICARRRLCRHVPVSVHNGGSGARIMLRAYDGA